MTTAMSYCKALGEVMRVPRNEVGTSVAMSATYGPPHHGRQIIAETNEPMARIGWCWERNSRPAIRCTQLIAVRLTWWHEEA